MRVICASALSASSFPMPLLDFEFSVYGWRCMVYSLGHVSSSSYDMYPPPHMTCRCMVYSLGPDTTTREREERPSPPHSCLQGESERRRILQEPPSQSPFPTTSKPLKPLFPSSLNLQPRPPAGICVSRRIPAESQVLAQVRSSLEVHRGSLEVRRGSQRFPRGSQRFTEVP